MADFYIVPPRLTVGTFDRAAVVNSINGLRGDLTFTADPLTGIKIVSYGNNIQVGFIPDFYVKKSGDTIFGNINFTPSGSNYGLSVGVSATDPGTGTTGAIYFNTTTNELKIYDNFGWNPLTASGGISEAYANTLYLRLDGTNTPTGNISMGSVLFRLGNIASTPGSGSPGQIYYNTSSNQVEFYNGTSWRPIGLGITSITAGFGLTTGTNPITSFGTLSVDTYANYTWFGNHTFNNPVTFASAAQSFEISKLFISGQSKGDLIVFNGTNWTRVGVGTSGYALVANPNTATGVTWSLSNANPGGTNRNLQYNNNGVFGGASNFNYYDDGVNPNLLISASGGTITPFRIKAASGQTSDLFSIVSNTDSNLFKINAYGSIIARSGSASSYTAPIYLQSGTNLTYPESGALEFDGQKLTFTPSSTRKQISNIYIGTSAPIGSTDGDFWWNSEQGNLKIYYIDGDGSQYWVDAFSGATGAGIFVTAYVDGIKELNGLTGSTQDFAVGSSGNLFNIVSSGNTHTFNIPIASIASTGLVSTLSQTFSGSKSFQNDVIINSTSSNVTLTSGALRVSGGLAVSGNASFGSTLFIFNKNNSNYIGFRYTSTVGSTVYTLPVSTPNSSSLGSSVLSATNDGLMSWVPLIASSGNVSTGDTKSVAYYTTAGTAITGSSNFKYDPDYLDTLTLGGMTFVGSGNSAIQITSVGNGGQILSTWNTLNSGLALDASNASLRIVGDTNAIGTLVDFGIYDNSGFPTGNWNSKYLFPSLTEAIFVNGLKILNTTNSDSPITGALNILGGVGISKSASIGGTLYIYEGTGASYVGFRSGNLIGSTIYTLPDSTPQSSLGTSVLSSTPSGILSWVPMTAIVTGGGGAGTVFEGNKFAIAYYPETGSAVTSSPSFTNVGTGVSILYTAQSTATNNGALVVNGGVGISANLNVGGQINGIYISSGVVTSGTWAGSTITSYYGGTGFSSFASGDLLVGLGGTLYKLPIGSNSQILSVDSTLDHKIKWINNTGGSGSGTVFYGNAYEIPFYPSSGTAITGSSYFTNVGTGISILYSATSNSTSTGALVVYGGVGISENLNIGGSINGIRIASGIVTSGIWAGTALTSNYGGFGSIPVVNKGDILVGSGNTWYNLPYSASNNQVLLVDTSQPFGVKWAALPAAGSTSIAVDSTNSSGPFFLTFVNAASGTGLAVSTDSDLIYDAALNSLSLGNLISSYDVGIGRTLTFSNTSNSFTVGFSASTSTGASVLYTLPENYPQGSGTSVLKSDLSGILSWVPMTATGGGAGNTVYISPDPPGSSNSGDLWWDNVDGSLSLYYNDGDSSQWVEIVNAFVGMATTNVELAAKSERAFTVDVQTGNGNTSYYLTFVKPNSGSGLALSSGLGLSFNPTDNTLTTGNINATVGTANQPNITGLGTITSGVWAGTTITSYYGGTGYSIFTSGDLLVGLGSSLYKLPVGSNKSVLQVNGSELSGVGWTGYNTNTISSNAPSNASNGDFWWNNDDGSLSIYYTDGTSDQWVEVISGYAGIDGSKDLKLTSSTASTNLITGALVVTGGVGIGKTLNAATIGVNNIFENIGLSYTASSISANQIAHSIDSTSYRTLKYVVQVSCGTSFDSSEIMIVHDGTNTSFKQNSQVLIGTGVSLSSFSSDINSNNLRLKVSPLVSPSIYNISCIAMRV